MVNFQHMSRYDLEDLRRIMTVLRSPEGCPWDREQTHASIRRDMLEEAYEVAEAIDNNDAAALKEELGDVLWYCAETASALGLQLDDVAANNIHKLEMRYPEGFSSERSVNRGENDG